MRRRSNICTQGQPNAENFIEAFDLDNGNLCASSVTSIGSFDNVNISGPIAGFATNMDGDVPILLVGFRYGGVGSFYYIPTDQEPPNIENDYDFF